jgi:hypothetical protein
MTIFLSKKNIYPIILQQRFYVDRFGNQNAYIETSPSMNIDNNGNVKILVRLINYRKYYNKQRIDYEDYVKSTYVLLCGKIEENKSLEMEKFYVSNIECKYNIPTYHSYWKGLEDIQFINSTSILAVIPECNSKNNPSIFYAKLENNKIHSFTSCKPNNLERYWMPYIDKNKNNTAFVIYNLFPFLIKNIYDSNTRKINNIPAPKLVILKDYFGSTNGVHYKNNYYLFLIHTDRERTYHRWLLFDLITDDIQLSQEFVFFNYSYIETALSLCKLDNRIFVSLGVNDDKAFIIETTIEIINQILPVIKY